MIDVAQRIVTTSITRRQEPRGDVPEDEVARLPVRTPHRGDGVGEQEVELDTLRDDVKRLVDAHGLVLVCRDGARHHVGADVRGRQEAGLVVGEGGVVDVHDDVAVEQRDLVEVGAQGAVVPAVRGGEQRLVAPPFRRVDHPELDATPETRLTRAERHVEVDPGQTGEERPVPRVVVTVAEPDVVVEDLLARGAGAEQGPRGTARATDRIDHRLSPAHLRTLLGSRGTYRVPGPVDVGAMRR